MAKDSNTRSSLLWQVERLLYECKDLNTMPQILCMENVPAIHSKKNMPDFEKWLESLENLGYVTFWQDLNAKDYGVAQNRQRCFAISILKSELGDCTYTFPEPIPLKKRLKDYLEEEVDESFYVKNDKADKLIGSLIDKGVLPFENDKQSCEVKNVNRTGAEPEADSIEVAHTLMARDYKGLANFASNAVTEKVI